FPRPRGAALFLTPFLRGHSSGGEGHRSATRLGYRMRTRLLAPRPRTSRTQHSCGLRRPRSAERGGCAGSGVPAGPDTRSFPAPWPFKSGGLVSQGRGQLGKAHGWGGSSGDRLLLRGRGPAGVGRTLGWRLGAKPVLGETALRRSRFVPRPTP